VVGLSVVFWIFISNAGRAIFKRSFWSTESKLIWGSYTMAATSVVFSPRWNLPRILYSLSNNEYLQSFAKFVHLHIPNYVQALLIPLPLFLYGFVLEIPAIIRNRKMENSLKHLGLKSPTGLEPKVIGVERISESKTKISVQSVGIDVASFQSKKGTIEASLNKIVQEVRQSPTSKQVVEIIASDKELPKMVRFDTVSEKLSRPYMFLVGEANSGFMTGDLRELHHMLIAGSTGGGKSVFFKQALIGILKSSKYVQLYLIDLKRGVEMKLFEALPNAHIAKEVPEALDCLRKVVAEMDRRFVYLEKKGFTEIDSERDKLDRIVVGVDEASVLFTVERTAQFNKENAHEARELTDKLTKLGRAAGIHVILATQKVTKETIDTRVQTNVHAKICFRVNTIASSMTVLGNKMAAELPEIKGRGIWSVGSNDVEVQVPFLSHEEAADEIAHLSQKFSETQRANFQKLLTNVEEVKKAGVVGNTSDFDSSEEIGVA
jgi:hypothetical protein